MINNMDISEPRQADALRTRAVELSKGSSSAIFALAEVLSITYRTRLIVADLPVALYEAWGFESWGEYVERELAIHKGTAHGWRRMHETFFVKLANDWDRSLIASATKMKALTRVVKKSNVESWLKRAAKFSCCQLEEAVMDALYGNGKKGEMHHFTAVVTGRELTILNTVLEIAHDQYPDEDRAGLLVKIAEEWEALRGPQKAKPKRRVARAETSQAAG